jgi:patatin-like phospholipase/acyl hydrolase
LGGISITGHFDMVAGTSTGGIIALALAKGMTAQDALRIYLDKGERIFTPMAGTDVSDAYAPWCREFPRCETLASN